MNVKKPSNANRKASIVLEGDSRTDGPRSAQLMHRLLIGVQRTARLFTYYIRHKRIIISDQIL